MTQKEFILKAIEKNPQFDFSKSKFIGKDKDIVVICPKHGEFIRKAGTFTAKHTTCPYCDLEERKEQFIKDARAVHGDKYDYSKVIYKTNKIPVEIICPIHGSFWQAPGDHKKGYGCDKCSKKHKPTTEEWIASVKDLYGGIYDFSKVEYKTNKTPVTIICPKHGEFYPLPSNFSKGISGCPKCNDERKHQQFSKTTEQFIEDAKRVHGDKYDYSKVEYVNSWKEVCIICPIHGEFWQKPTIHLSGSGCQKCINKNQTNLYNKLKETFPEEEILFEFSPKWLGQQHFDIYFPKYNIAIEYDGQQHFIPIEKFGGELKFKDIIRWDKLKEQKCLENKCVLIRIKFNYKKSDFNKLINIINKNIKNPKVEIIKINY